MLSGPGRVWQGGFTTQSPLQFPGRQLTTAPEKQRRLSGSGWTQHAAPSMDARPEACRAHGRALASPPQLTLPPTAAPPRSFPVPSPHKQTHRLVDCAPLHGQVLVRHAGFQPPLRFHGVPRSRHAADRLRCQESLHIRAGMHGEGPEHSARSARERAPQPWCSHALAHLGFRIQMYKPGHICGVDGVRILAYSRNKVDPPGLHGPPARQHATSRLR